MLIEIFSGDFMALRSLLTSYDGGQAYSDCCQLKYIYLYGTRVSELSNGDLTSDDLKLNFFTKMRKKLGICSSK